MDKLLNCPLCGADAERWEADNGSGYVEYHTGCSNNKCGCSVTANIDEQHAHADKLWNQRHTQSLAGDDVELHSGPIQSVMWLVFDYARLADGIDSAEGEARVSKLAAMAEKDMEIRTALRERIRRG